MPASIWLRLSDGQETSLRMLIAQLADAHGTVPFQPHLTVCSPQSSFPGTPQRNMSDAARRCPFALAKDASRSRRRRR